jgi:hypothetical protein
MNTTTRTLVAALLTLSAAVASAAVLPAGALRVQKLEVIDRQGFDRPMVAATMFVPAGWQQQGTVEWRVGNRCGSPHALRLVARAPDDSAAIALVPGEAWAANNFGAPAGECLQANIADTRAYLSAWVEHHRPGARVIDYRVRPDKSIPAQQQSFQGGGSSVRVETGQALIAYQYKGREVRETLAASVLFSQMRFTGVGGRVMQTLQGQSLGVLSWRAPEGQLDFRQFDAVWASLQPGREWKARIDSANAQMAADNDRTQREIMRIRGEMSRETMAHIARRGQIMADTRAEVAAIRNNTYAHTQATNDRMHTDNVRTLREVQGWRTPSGGPVVELSSHYNHAWQLRDGSFLLTDNSNFNPQRDLGIGGEQLVRSRER